MPLSVIVRNTMWSLMICLGLACNTRQEAGAPCPVVEVNAVADTQTDSTKAGVMLNDTTTVPMSRTPLVTTGDITAATASQADGQWVINVTVTDDAAKRVHDFTEQHVGRQLALVVDGKVHGTPRIVAAITGSSYRIEGFNQRDAERSAMAITNGCHR